MNRGINDRWDTPVRRMVVFGESHTVGASATRRELGWPEVVKALIDAFQDEPVELINRGLGADILSTACPLYGKDYEGKRPIGIERYRRHVIEEEPDLVVISFGYNDLRAGTPLEDFQKDLETIIKDVQTETESLVVLLNTYAIPGDGYKDSGKKWDKGTREIHTLYNLMLHDVAEEYKLLFCDIHGPQVRTPWTFCSPDGTGDIHANDLGHRLIAHRIFETLATKCSFLSLKAQEDRDRTGKSPWRYGARSPEAKLIAEFYPDSPAAGEYGKKPSGKGKRK